MKRGPTSLHDLDAAERHCEQAERYVVRERTFRLQQRAFCAWWKAHVSVRHGGDSKNADKRSWLSVAKAGLNNADKRSLISVATVIEVAP